MYHQIDVCCLCLNKQIKDFCHLRDYYEKINNALPNLNFGNEYEDYMLCLECCDTINLVYEFNNKCIRNLNKFLSYNMLITSPKDKSYELDITLSDVKNIPSDKKNVKFQDTNTTIHGSHLPECSEDNQRGPTSQRYALNDISHESSDIDIKIAYSEVKIEELDISDTCPHEDDYLRQNQATSGCSSVQNILEMNCNSKLPTNSFLEEPEISVDNEVCNTGNGIFNDNNEKGFTHSLTCIKREETDINELIWEKGTLNENDETHDIKRKIEFVSVKIEEPDVISTYLNEDGTNKQNESRKTNMDLTEQIINNYEHQSNISNKNNKQNASLTTHNDNPYKCDVFNKGFTQSTVTCSNNTNNSPYFTILNRILTDQHFKCNVCNMRLGTSDDLAKHTLIHNKEKSYKCDVCNTRFVTSDDLVTHTLIHDREKPHKCDECNKRFKLLKYLQGHKRSHTSVKPYMCDVCNQGFTQSCILKRHKRTHTGEKPCVCPVCNKGFTETGLAVHKLTHTGEKPFKCEVCNKEFRTSSSLTKHNLIHTGEKPYKCDVCLKEFRSSSNLTTHKFTHTGEKPYTCKVCNKGFIVSSNLTAHKLTHTGEKRYNCNLCGKGFSVSRLLKRHMLYHTDENVV